jgi:hypothetical protein
MGGAVGVCVLGIGGMGEMGEVSGMGAMVDVVGTPPSNRSYAFMNANMNASVHSTHSTHSTHSATAESSSSMANSMGDSVGGAMSDYRYDSI